MLPPLFLAAPSLAGPAEPQKPGGKPEAPPDSEDSFKAFGGISAKSDRESTAGLEWEHYFSPPRPGSHHLRDYFSAALDYRQTWRKGHFSLKGHVLAKYYLDKSRELYFDIPEIYGSYSYSFQKKIYSIESVDAAFGRKIKKWSFADDYWEMGVWNPQNLWNPMRASWNGLIGSFVDINSRRWTLSLFAGPLHLPGSRPKWKRPEGRIFSSSRWFSSPPGRVDVARRSLLDIKYHIDHPFLLDILLQQSYALSLEMRAGRAGNLWAKLSGGYKPINDLTIALETEEFLKVFSEEGKKSQVQPQVTYLPAKQWALSLDSGLKLSLRDIDLSCVLSSGISKTAQKQDLSAASPKLALLHGKNDFSYFSALVKAAFSPGHYAQAGYLKSWLKNKKARGALNFDRRKIWHGPGFEWHWEGFSPKKLKRALSFKFRYSLPEKGGALSIRALFYLFPKVFVAATADVLGAKASSKDRFLGHFQANDYFGLKAAYVF